MDILTDRGRIDAPHQVVCLDLDLRLIAAGHHHALGVETRRADGVRQRWSSVQAISAIRDGAIFVVDGVAEATVEPGLCPICPFVTLRTEGQGQLPACAGAASP